MKRLWTRDKTLWASILCGVAGAGLLHLYLMRLKKEVAGGPPVPVLVAAHDIPLGAKLTEGALGVRPIPQAYVETRHVRKRDVERVLGGRISSGLKAGEALLWTDLAALQAEGRSLSSLISDGRRAITIDARAATFEGLLRPGDRVDVLLTTGKRLDGSSMTTRTLVQNLLVLAVGSDTGKADGLPPGQRGGVTLSATAEQSQRLAQAEQMGRLKLVLRSPDDIVLLEDLAQTGPKDLLERTPQLPWGALPARRPEREIDHVR